ncbi:MAG TPA: sialidase family protein [Vicinamibacterales bacterium]|nr:exo-alpha-sialidase [Acidobacteriota bacterium]HOC19098.1 sialidase family protein [Vicinamibacterales bacterium]
MLRAAFAAALATAAVIAQSPAPPPPRGLRTLDLSADTARQVIVDREPGQYLGHPTTVLLEDTRTMLVVYPKGHGRGPIVMKRSEDGGRTWSGRLEVPASWATSQETPTLHRVVDARGAKRLILFSGLYPIRMSVSEDDGRTWSELKPIGDFGGIVAMASVVPVRTGPGHYLAFFHDDGRFFTAKGAPTTPPTFTVYQSRSIDGGLTWGAPAVVWSGQDLHLCEPGAIRSPDGARLALLLRENSRRRNSHAVFSGDEGKTWSRPVELPASLTGDRHVGRYAPDGRLFVSFRDMAANSPTQGDWVAWIGTWDDIASGREGQYRVRLADNHNRWDSTYPGVEVLPDGTIVTTTYGHWTPGEQPYILSVRLKLPELDAMTR